MKKEGVAMESTYKERIKDLAESNGISLTELANHAGLTYKMLWKSLNNERTFKPNELVAIAKALNTTTDFLLGETDDIRTSKSKNFTELLGARIRDIRRQNGVTVNMLASAMHVSVNTIARWENGTIPPRANELHMLAKSLNTSVAYLLCETDDPRPLSLFQALIAGAIKGPVDSSIEIADSPYVPNDGTKGRVKNPDDMLVGDHKGLMQWLRDHGVTVSDDLIYVPILSPELTACCGSGISILDFTSEYTEVMPFDRKIVGAIDDMNPPYVVHSDGYSMVGYGITPGALCLINPAEKVNVGDIALIKYGDSSMIKKVYWRRDGAELKSSDGDNLTVSTEDFESGWVQVVGRLMATAVRY
jgi:transcriptional regulator with XRE-family HTH domain